MQRLAQWAPLPQSGANEILSDELEAWLRDYVVPVVEDLLDNPVFRRIVSAICEQLLESSDTEERRQIDDFADSVVTCASALVNAAEEFGVHEVLADSDRADDERWIAADKNANIDPRSVTEKAVDRPWLGMVTSQDFWSPTFSPQLRVTDALLVRQFRRSVPFVKLLGDRVSSMLVARCNFWKHRLDSTGQRLQIRLGGEGNRAFKAQEEILNCLIEIDHRYQLIRQRWLAGPERRLRDACFALLQTYVAYHPYPQIPWLGVASQTLSVNGGVLKAFFRHRGTVKEIELISHGRARVVGTKTASLVDTNLIRQVAAALDDLGEIYRRGAHPDEIIEEARSQYALLVVVRPRLVFWNGERLALEWNDAEKSWNLLLNLAVRAEGKLPLHAFTLTGVRTNRDQSVRKLHLRRYLSSVPHGDELAARIEKHRGGDCYLDMDSGAVKVLDLDADDWTVEVNSFGTPPIAKQ
jgi:hypothetical protein